MTNDLRLFDLRRIAGRTQKQVAEFMGIGQAQVSRIEAQYPDIRFLTLRAYLDALGIDIRFTKDGELDVLSGDVVEDTSRNYLEGRRTDPTRRVQAAKEAS